MPGPEASSHEGGLEPPPISLGIRFMDATLQTIEWVGPPERQFCLACGSGSNRGHTSKCPVAMALEPGTGLDALDGAVGEGVFLTASHRYTLLEQVRLLTRTLVAMEAKITWVQYLLPRS